LIRSLKRAWPHAAIDVLVFKGTEGVLLGNPDIREVRLISERPSLWEHLRLAWRIARRYGVALSLVASDRPTVYAWLAGRWHAGLVVDEAKHRWKKWLLRHWIALDDLNTHTVLMNLALARLLGVAPAYEVVVRCNNDDRAYVQSEGKLGTDRPYAVLHPFPKFNYKMWRTDAWVALARSLQARGLRVVLSGSGERAELDYVAGIARDLPDALNLAGKLSLSQVACLLAGARLYVGPDTALTHMAAALGVKVVALYGPSNPVKWGPWPHGYAHDANPWRRHGSRQMNNVTLVQGTTPCVPCLKEGCDRHIASYSDCLQELAPQRVIDAVADTLATTAPT
jgi:heptosyltransferase-3